MTIKELRAMRKQEKQRLIQETNELIAETKEDLPDYEELKKWKWWHLAISFALIIFGIGLAFLVGYLTYNSPKTPGWQGVAWFALTYALIESLLWLVLGYVKNQRSARFYQNRRQRYRPTYQMDEARIQVVRRIILVALVPYLIFAITVAFVL